MESINQYLNDNVSKRVEAIRKPTSPDDADRIAAWLVDAFKSPVSYKFYCKVAYCISEPRIQELFVQSQQGNNPGGLFNYLCSKEINSIKKNKETENENS